MTLCKEEKLRAQLGCIPCFIKQAVTAACLSTDDQALRRKAVDLVLERVRGMALDDSPARLSDKVYAAVREVTGVCDPFAAAKRETNRRALNLVPDLRRKIAVARDPLHTAIKVALIGNVIDLGIGHRYDLERDLASILERDVAIDDYASFKELLQSCRKMLYICDNSGEIAFDALLIERLKERCEVVASVKSGPIINDATHEDADEVGLTGLVRVVGTGTNHIGVDLENASREFMEEFESADVVLAKGQGNFETLDQTPKEIFFLLKAKCAEVARAIGTEEGATVFVRRRAEWAN